MRLHHGWRAVAGVTAAVGVMTLWHLAPAGEQAAAQPGPAVSTASSAPTTVPGAPTAAPGPNAASTDAVERDAFVLDDPSRKGPDRGSGDVSDQRVVRVLIWRPAGVSGPLPVIVFAHGYDTDPDTYARLLDAWAADGYLVAAPDLPGSSDDLPGAPVRDIGDQATDLSLVLTALLDGRAGPVEPSRLIAAGHSDGGSAVAALAMNSSLVDPRFGTYMVLSGAIADQITDGTWGPGPAGHRMLVMVGANDEYGNVPAASEVWSTAALRGASVVVPGGDHQGLYVDDSPLARRVRAVTVDFLNSKLSRPS